MEAHSNVGIWQKKKECCHFLLCIKQMMVKQVNSEFGCWVVFRGNSICLPLSPSYSGISHKTWYLPAGYSTQSTLMFCFSAFLIVINFRRYSILSKNFSFSTVLKIIFCMDCLWIETLNKSRYKAVSFSRFMRVFLTANWVFWDYAGSSRTLPHQHALCRPAGAGRGDGHLIRWESY